MKIGEFLPKAVAGAAAIAVLGGCATQNEFSVRQEAGNPDAVLVTRDGKLQTRIMCSQAGDGAIGQVFGPVADFRDVQEIDALGLPNPCRKDGMIEPAEYVDTIRLASGLGWIR